MSEKKETEKKEDNTKKKVESRKFVVWIVWLIITLLIISYSFVVIAYTKQLQDKLEGLIERTLSWFFAISMMYLGMNVTQKLGLAVTDKLMPKEVQGEEESDAQ